MQGSELHFGDEAGHFFAFQRLSLAEVSPRILRVGR